MALDLAETWELPEYGLTFNTGIPDENGAVYWVTEDAGWRGGSAPQPNRQNKSYANGQFRRPNFSTGLVVTWNGFVDAPNGYARAMAERKMAAIGRDPFSLFTLVGTDSVGSLYAEVERDGPFLPTPITLEAFDFSMQFGSKDPHRYVYGAVLNGATGLPVSSGGLDWDTGGGLDWDPGLDWGSVSSSGQIFFNNTGTAAAWPIWTIESGSGALNNPQITSSSGEILKYAGSLPPGSTLVLQSNPWKRSVILNGSTDVTNNVSPAQWFSLPVGASSVTFSATNVNATASLTGTAPIAGW